MDPSREVLKCSDAAGGVGGVGGVGGDGGVQDPAAAAGGGGGVHRLLAPPQPHQRPARPQDPPAARVANTHHPCF